MRLTRRDALKAFGITIGSLVANNQSIARAAVSKKRPNILWLSTEDISANLGCYGDKNAITPTLDKLAQEGTRYSRAFTPAGVCAPCRSSIITGVNASSLGTLDMRCKALLPEKINCFPKYLRDAGYYCTNNSKQDYQIDWKHTGGVWDESSDTAHWRKGPKDKPFFSIFNFKVTHEGRLVNTDERRHKNNIPRLTPDQRQDIDKMQVPPYLPQTKTAKRIWAQYLEVITQMDYQAADILNQLKEDGLEDDTIVIFWSDHGVGLPRAKRWVYDSGLHVPLIARIPEKYRVGKQGKPGTVCDDLISLIDLAPTVLNLAGLPIPDYMQAQPFLGSNIPAPREYVHAARGRIDERHDMVRSVRDKRYHYIKNYHSFKPYHQFHITPEKGEMMKELRRLHAEGKLPPEAEQFMADTRYPEELYDTKTDPHEVNNLIDSPKLKKVLKQLKAAHYAHLLQTLDTGFFPEADLVEREKQFGNRYDILRQITGRKLLLKLYRICDLAQNPGPGQAIMLSKSMNEKDPAVRFWAATGLGNAGIIASRYSDKLIEALKDSSPSVRIASARALAKMDMEDKALPVLCNEVTSDKEWARLEAAIVLDEMGQKARPAIDALKESRKLKGNKYVARVANHALEALGEKPESKSK